MKPLIYFFIRFVSIFLLLIYGAENLGSQTAIKTNLPRLMKANATQTFELAIKGNGKGAVSAYELTGPDDVVFKALSTPGADVRIDGKMVRVDFRNTKDITIETVPVKLTLYAGGAGTYSLSHKVFYSGEQSEEDFEFAASIVKVEEGSGSGSTGSGFTTIREKNAPFNSEDFRYTDPESLRQQLLQSYSDSRQITSVGESEKLKAREKLSDAEVLQALLTYIDDQRVKKKLNDHLADEKERAIADYRLAQHIVAAGRSMEQNAMSYKEWIALMEKEMANDLHVKEFNSLGYESMTSQYNKAQPNTFTSDALYYRIQVGAFKKRCPRKTEFARLGSVDIVRENGWYKVLIGHFISREEALQQHQTVVATGQDAFIAAYKNGKREM